jgi:hypothetical protein
MSRRAALLMGLGLLPAACAGGGGSSGQYAGLTQYEATQDALVTISHVVNQPGDPLYRTQPELVKMVRGESAERQEAWVAVFFAKKRRERACVWISNEHALLTDNESVFVDTCPKNVLRTKAGEQAYG